MDNVHYANETWNRISEDTTARGYSYVSGYIVTPYGIATVESCEDSAYPYTHIRFVYEGKLYCRTTETSYKKRSLPTKMRRFVTEIVRKATDQ